MHEWTQARSIRKSMLDFAVGARSPLQRREDAGLGFDRCPNLFHELRRVGRASEKAGHGHYSRCDILRSSLEFRMTFGAQI